jgi:phenylacetate-CoA ligase
MTPDILNPIEVASADQVRNIQNVKLREQLAYLEKSSPFYVKLLAKAGADIKDIKTVDDLAGLPFTTKEDLRESQWLNPPFGDHLAAQRADIVRVHASSGTTGVPSYIPVTAKDSALWREAVKRAYWCQGLRPTSTFAMGFGIGFFVGGIPLAQGVEDLGATFLPIGTGATERLLDSIPRMDADVLACTPSYAIFLAETAKSKYGIDVSELGIKRVMVGAEPGGGVPEIRRQIEEAWGATVTESVGNADVCPIHSAETHYQEGNHFLIPDMVIMEIIDPDSGKVLALDAPDVEGEMVFTHITREAVPLLRFRSSDRVQVRNGPCANGRTGPRIRVIGRTDDLLILRGVNVWPSAIKDVITSMRPATSGAMKILLPTPGPMVDSPLKIEVEQGEQTSDTLALGKKIENALREKLIFTASVTIVPPGSIERFEMKTKLIYIEGED